MGRKKVTGNAEDKEDVEDEKNPRLRFKSPAEFFAENKNIAGFDNPGKSLYTTIRELVENGLDAAEAVPILPEITVHVEELSQAAFNQIVGMHDVERIDESLYKDVETDRERKRREAKEKRDAKRKKISVGATGDGNTAPTKKSKKEGKAPLEVIRVEEKNGPENGDKNKVDNEDVDKEDIDKVEQIIDGESLVPESQMTLTGGSDAITTSQQPLSQSLAKVVRGEVSILRVTVRDNGIGMAHKDVPDMLGRVLAGTKYCVKQSRGKFGLGSKMALIWSKMSTSLPVEIRTAREGAPITKCTLDIDISKNIPNVLVHEKVPNEENWRGTEICVTIQGSWTTYRAKILQYMRQMAIITPYAQFEFRFSTARADRSFDVTFSRRSDQMPAEPLEVKHHPSSINQLLLKQLLSDVKPEMTLVKFLTKELSSIEPELAERLINELGGIFRRDMRVDELGLNEIRRLDALFKGARFPKPNGECLSPAGEYNLRLGILKELKPDMVATHAEVAEVFEGHPFIVEVGVSLGGEQVKPGLNIYRFANRIPLLFEAGNDVVSRTARESITWTQYKISGSQDRIGVFCSIVSTRIPFKGTGKEYIGDDATDIKNSVKRAIQSCCIQLKTKLTRKAEMKNRQERKRNLRRYAPDVASALFKFLESLEAPTVAAPYVEQMKQGILTRDLLLNKLIQHVDNSDMQQALEYATATGRDEKSLEVVHIAPRQPQEHYSATIQNDTPLTANTDDTTKPNSKDEQDAKPTTTTTITPPDLRPQLRLLLSLRIPEQTISAS